MLPDPSQADNFVHALTYQIQLKIKSGLKIKKLAPFDKHKPTIHLPEADANKFLNIP